MKYPGNPYEQFLQEILSQKNILVGSELSGKLREKFSIRPDNARKIIQRACEKKLINSSQPMSFGKGQFAYFLGATKLTKEKIKRISKVHRPPLFRLLAGIEANDGIASPSTHPTNLPLQ